jgi:glycosyltransferase involved in cell wall biosynthesis
LNLLLAALAELPSGSPPWQLTLYGRGPQEAELQALAKWLGLEARVHWAGYQPDLAEIWKEQELLISPALDEGIPLTVPEAMLHARPVLATRVGGAEHWLKPGEGGYLCAPGSVPPLVEALELALRDAPRWPGLGLAGRARALALLRPDDPLRLLS